MSLCSMEFCPRPVSSRTGLVSELENDVPKLDDFVSRLIGVREGGTGYPILDILCKLPPTAGKPVEVVALLPPLTPNFGTENRTALMIELSDLSPLSSKTLPLTEVGWTLGLKLEEVAISLGF